MRIVFAEGEPAGAEDRWFAALATRVADILHRGRRALLQRRRHGEEPAMARLGRDLAQRIADWIGRSRPQDLLSVDIFFDLRACMAMPRSPIRCGATASMPRAAMSGFAKLLAESAGSAEPGLNFFGGFRTAQGRIDLKKTGLFGIVTLARVLAIRHHVVERATPARLAGVKALGLGGRPGS